MVDNLNTERTLCIRVEARISGAASNLKTVGISSRGAIQQIVDYKNDLGMGSICT